MIRVPRFSGLLCLVLLLLGATAARSQPQAHGSGSRTYFNQDIFVAQGQQIRNAACIFCSVQIEGDLTGHVFVLFGSLNVTGRVEGRVTVVGGNAVIDSQARVGGNALVIGGNAVYETDESIAGNAWVIGGHLTPVNNRHSSVRRAAFSPVLFSVAGLAAFLLLSALFLPRRRSGAA
ncbi:MAG TPA: hypothetical protein VGB69_02210 [Edaphobacter sp.]